MNNVINFYDVESTGSSLSRNSDGTGSLNIQHYPKIIWAVIFAGCLTFGSPQSYQKNELGIKELLIEQQILSNFQAVSHVHSSTKEQLFYLKNVFGLNISEISAILLVSRPTVYDWFGAKELNIRKKHLERLHGLYMVCNEWGKKKLGRLGSYLHRPLDHKSLSLFSLLSQEALDIKNINKHLNRLSEVILARKQKAELYEKTLQRHGFKPISNEDRDDRLNDIEFLD